MIPAPDFPLPDPADPLASVWVGNAWLLPAVNAARAVAGRRPYIFHGTLAHVAGLQAARCVALGRMTHDRPDGTGPAAEYRAAGWDVLLEEPVWWRWVGVGEVVFAAPRWPVPELAPDAAGVTEAWLRSAGHRAAVLGRRPTHAGFGWAYAGDGTLFVVGAMGKR